ncbi:MAG: hypothetical protein IKY90_00750 [Oscillospiraceae bacterium]|nr:hypothetical protein [Oscillospiraceae bacterium]
MKKFIKEEYADIILQMAQQYITNHPEEKGREAYIAMEKTLETMDMYVAWINNMGFMMHRDSIEYMIAYIQSANGSLTFPKEKLEEIRSYLLTLL